MGFDMSEIDGHRYSGLDPDFHNPDMSEGTKEALLSMFGFYGATRDHYPREGQREGWGSSVDTRNTYSVDKHGYRNSVEIGKADIIVSGCSQTYGVGIPEEARWGNQLGELMGMSQVTVAVPGWSVQSMVNGVMSYIGRYGKPKIVALLLPDFFRFDLLVNKKAMNYRLEDVRSPDPSPAARINDITSPYYELPKISKQPHTVKEIFPAEISYFLSGQFLRFFTEYCKEAEIVLVWGNTSHPVDEMVTAARIAKLTNEIQQPWVDFDSYVDVEYFVGAGESILTEKSCHSDLRDKYKEYFDYGTDKNIGGKPHMGVHMHTHIAEKFKEEIEKR